MVEYICPAKKNIYSFNHQPLLGNTVYVILNTRWTDQHLSLVTRELRFLFSKML